MVVCLAPRGGSEKFAAYCVLPVSLEVCPVPAPGLLSGATRGVVLDIDKSFVSSFGHSLPFGLQMLYQNLLYSRYFVVAAVSATKRFSTTRLFVFGGFLQHPPLINRTPAVVEACTSP